MEFEWDERKCDEIKRRHGFSFEEVISSIKNESIIIKTPNEDRDQKAFLTIVDNYPVVVPFEMRSGVYRLITAWPDRRFKKWID
jgi:uncharacterized DUF497 family protein